MSEIIHRHIETESPNEDTGDSEVKLDLHQLYEELKEELDQARRERTELIELIKEFRSQIQESGPGIRSRPIEPKGVEPRMGLFVDVQSVFYNARNYFGRKLDFKRLMEVTTRDRTLGNAVAYLVFSPEIDQSNFIAMLEQNGYSAQEKMPNHQEGAGSSSETTAPMFEDIAQRSEELDLAVIVGVDGDLSTLVREIQSHGTKVELFGFTQNISDEITRMVDVFTPIDEGILLSQEYSPRQRPTASAPYRDSDGSRGANSSEGSGRVGTRGYTGTRESSWGADTRGS
jgi:uncharacterized LabA/DUF88 family protein